MSALKTGPGRFCQAAVLAWLIVCMPVPGLAQNLAPAAPPTSPHQYLELLSAREEADGIYAPDLLEPLMALGRLYREQGDYERSAASLARARQLLRSNQGLSTLEEVFLLEEWIRTEEARGNFAEARELEQALLTLAQLHDRNLQTFPIFRTLATKRLDLYARYRAGERPPQIFAGCYYAKRIDLSSPPQAALARILGPRRTGDSCSSGDRATVERALLIEALAYQGMALDVLLHNDHHTSEEMLALMHEIFHGSNQLNKLMGKYSDYYIARLWRRALGKEAQDAESRLRRAQLQLLFSDLNLLRMEHSMRTSRNDLALVHEQYAHVYRSLVAEEVDQEMLAEIFTPDLPIVIPHFDANPFVPAAGTGQGEYLDALLEIDSRGRGKVLQITNQTEGVTKTDQRNFRNLVRKNMFRPRMVEGEIAKTTSIVVRYHVNSPMVGQAGN